ncbi:MAG: Mu-like prophage major head subunit gpT family protein [Beijerinckiaceae bacterium]|nr:Mu-like prophage major head subunit gpT family protein [Beijerinckiaceae bacterium]
MKKSFCLAAMLFAVAAFSLAAFVPDAHAAALPFVGGGAHDLLSIASLPLAMRLLSDKRETLVAQAFAKGGEVKAGMSADEVRAIEQAHAALLAEVDTIDRELATMKAAPTPAPAPARDGFQAIYQLCRSAKLSADETDKIIADAGGSLDKAKDLVINMQADRDPAPHTRSQITITADSVDRFKMGAEKALISKAGFAGGEVNEFSGMTLRELARVSLSVRNIAAPHDPMQMLTAAFRPTMAGGMHSTSDFAEILSNVANKAMLKGYEETEETFEMWTARGTLGDFKSVSRIDLNLFPSLAVVPEGGEYSFGKLTDRAETIQLATYGKKFAITRQAIINDDMSVFTRVPSRMGRAARRTIGNLAYAVLTANAALADGVALFHADHTNLSTGGGSALSAASIDAARVAMAKQKDPESHATALNIRPRYLIVPVALGGTARVIMESQTNPDSESSTKPNKVRGLATIVEDARLDVASTTAWYLAGDPNAYDTVEVAYLNGNSTPVMEQQNGWDVDGVEYKVRIDAGVKALGHRALHKANGA